MDVCVHGRKCPTEPQLHVVVTGGWCVAKKKRNILSLHRTPPPMEKKKKKKKKRKKIQEVPSTGIEIANFDWIV